MFSSAARKHQLEVVYGAGNVGLMGEIAEGVIPQLLDKEVVHRGLSDLRIVNTIHERKALIRSCPTASSQCQAASEPLKNSVKLSLGRNRGFIANYALY